MTISPYIVWTIASGAAWHVFARDALGLPRVHGVQMVAERVLPALQPAALLHDPHEVTAYREPGPHEMNDAPGVHINGPFQLFFLNPAGRLIRFQK